jgi:hypothetical protein
MHLNAVRKNGSTEISAPILNPMPTLSIYSFSLKVRLALVVNLPTWMRIADWILMQQVSFRIDASPLSFKTKARRLHQ